MQTASVSSVSTHPTKSSDVAFGSLRIRTGDRGWPQECRLFGLSKAERECCASMSAQNRKYSLRADDVLLYPRKRTQVGHQAMSEK